MIKNDLTSAIEDKVNKVLKNFGLDNVDIKIYNNTNGKKEYDHVYTKDGETKHEHTEGKDVPEDTWTKLFEKPFGKTLRSFDELGELFEKKNEELNEAFEKIFSSDSPIFKQAYKEKGEDYVNKKIDEVGRSLKSNHFLKLFLEAAGVDMSDKTIQNECDKLKKYIKESCESDNKCTGKCKTNEDEIKTEMSGADLLKNSLIKEAEEKKRKEEEEKAKKEAEAREAARQKKLVIDSIYNEVDKMIKQRNFQLLNDDLNHPDAGICILIDQDVLHGIKIRNENFSFDVTRSIIDEIGNKIKNNYKFSKYESIFISDKTVKMIFYFN